MIEQLALKGIITYLTLSILLFIIIILPDLIEARKNYKDKEKL